MSLIRGIKVGSTNVITNYTGAEDSQPIEVTAVSLASIGVPSNTVYTGSAQEPTPAVYATVDGELIALVKDQDYTLSYSNNTDVGLARVTATGINNFTGTVYSEWTIGYATITVNAPDQTYTYNGYAQGIGISASTIAENTPTIKYRLTSSGEYTLTTAPQITNVSESKTIYYQVTAPNHNTETGTYDLEIIPIVANLTWGVTSWTYDGLAHSTTCVVSNLLSGDTCDVILSGNSITNIGSTTVTATGLTNSNYTLTGASDTTMTITIDPGLFVKLSGTWTVVKSVWKKISGEWVEQDMNSAFSTSERYKKMN